MASAELQHRWRTKHRFTKQQLNVMARRLVHKDLDETATAFDLRGKGEAVAFCSFLAKGLVQYAERDANARQLLGIFTDAYRRDRDLYT
jgi:hypothetical protein